MNKNWLGVLVCVSMIACGAAAAPAPQVKNPEFGGWSNGLPAGWNLKAYRGKCVSAAEDGALKITLSEGGNVNLGQKISGFKPGAAYRFSFKYRKETADPDCIPGLSVKVHPLKKGAAISPVWIMTAPVAGKEWQEASAVFTMPDGVGAVAIGFICVAKRNNTEEIVWLKSPGIQMESTAAAPAETKEFHGVSYRRARYVPEHPPLEFNAKELEQGILSFVPAAQDGLRPEYRPSRNEINRELRLFSARDAVLNATVALYPLKDWRNLRVVLDPFADGQGNTAIASADTKVLAVKVWEQRTAYRSFEYYRIPELLEEFSALDLANGEFKQLWLIVKIGKNMKPGELRSSIRLLDGDREIMNIPVVCQVLDYDLETPAETRWGLYSDDGRWLQYSAAELTEELKAIREQGINTLRLSPPSYLKLAEENGRLKVDILPRWNEILTLMKTIGFHGPYWMNIQSLGGIIKKAMPAAAEDRKLFDASFRQVMEFLEKGRKESGAPEFIYQVTDEANSLVLQAVHELTILRQMNLPTMCTVAYEADYDFLDLLDVRCYGGMPFNQEGLNKINANALKSGARNWWYGTGCYAGQEKAMKLNRAGSGFYHWKIGLSHVWAWTFQRAYGSPYDDFDRHTKDACLVYPSRTGKSFIPTLAWQGIAEGYHDYRYIQTLHNYIGRARNSGIEPIRAAASRHETMLTELLEGIPWNGMAADDLMTNETMQKYRYLIAEATLELKNMLAGNLPAAAEAASPPEILSAELTGSGNAAAGIYFPETDCETIPFARSPVKIDGDLSDEAWKGLKPFLLRKTDGGRAGKATRVYALHDHGFLYVAFDCDEPAMDKLRSKNHPPNSVAVTEDDCVELFLDKEHRHQNFYQIAVNSSGSVFSCEYTKKENDNVLTPSLKDFSIRRAVTKHRAGYSVELAIPLAEINSRHHLWGVNFCRESRSDGTEISCWSPTYGYFARPERFGHVILEPAEKGIAGLKLADVPLFGKNSWVLEFKGNPETFPPVETREKDRKKPPSRDGRLGVLNPGSYEFQVASDQYFSANFPVDIPEIIQCDVINPVIGDTEFLTLQFRLQVNRGMRENLELEFKCVNEASVEGNARQVSLAGGETDFTVRLKLQGGPKRFILKSSLKQGGSSIIELKSLIFRI